VLRPVEQTFKTADYPDLLVGLGPPDDAAVWRLDETRALVLTTDFFTPVVDDAYDYGAIAAANSLSDVYAMGGKPFLGLNIAALPPDLPPDLLGEIVRGAAEKAREAGVVIAGGHTVQDQEPKFGLVVLGMVSIDRMLTKRGLRPGDRLVLTKPLGFGVTTTALKREEAAAEDVAEAVGWMKRLNRVAGEVANATGLRAGTDVTGYSLLGHGWEMAQASGVGLRFVFEQIPFLSCARRYAEAWTFPGGAADNHLFFSEHVRFAPHLDDASRMLLFDPQTSGGLLLGVPPEKLPAFREQAAGLGQEAWEIGQVVEGNTIEVI
jgi:selenide, water dikinase